MDKIRKLKSQTQPSGLGVSGQSMDRKVQKKTSLSKKAAYVAGALAALAVLDGAAAEAAQPWVTRAQAYIDMRAALETIEARALDRLRAAGGA